MTDELRLRHPLAGNATVAEESIWSFPEGLIGLSDLKRFALLPLESAAPFQLLCAANGSPFGIVVVDPRHLLPEYVLSLSAEELHPIQERDVEQLEIRVPVVLPTERTPLTLNLKGPIVLSPRENVGVQRISPDETHTVRFAPSLTGTGTTSCSS